MSALFLVPGLALETRDNIILLGILFAIVGWLFSSAVAIHNRVKQHTFDLILRTRFDESYITSVILVNKLFPSDSEISETEASEIYSAESGKIKELRSAIANVLNFYEILAISVWFRDANEDILREYYKDVLVRKVKTLHNFFKLWRTNEKEAFVYVEWLYNRWKIKLAP